VSTPPERAGDAPETAALWEALEERTRHADHFTNRWYWRSLSSPVRRALGLAVLLLVALAVATLTLRGDWHVYPTWRMALAAGAFAGLASVVVLATLGRDAAPGARRTLTACALVMLTVVVTAGLALLGPAHVATASALPPPHSSLLSHALPCLVFGLATGAPVLLCTRLLDRDARPWLAAAAGALAGNLALQLHCPITQPEHLVWGHFMVTVALIAPLTASALARSVGTRRQAG
jgi:hypothetical protein